MAGAKQAPLKSDHGHDRKGVTLMRHLRVLTSTS
ncbi:hypothetical protein Q030_01870 [Pseudomonas aeruginosa BWHPSA017]|jgi:hypothetical protein|nr:hypothetical protein Q035_06372 [Pseudomonas aeruginosa BWHPSA022]ERW51353.1 hypothetical protein Q030_01870 [Pseudomonas aeruginosa BWHPSA017]ERX00563.1 hypothetical protein Q016_04055 [Pseudomonas aeruginosa BWHPSA003]ERY04919.1 hypothetical protein Q078_01828 [Pseudomonas aeruginosa BL24]MDA1405473.1 hypothetical protein [Pseudomonas aeruginosa]